MMWGFQAYLEKSANRTSVWSDFTADSGSSMDDFKNGATSPKTTSELNMEFGWKLNPVFAPGCVQMKPANEYKLEPTSCSGEANYVCMKPVCPKGFQWYDKESCALVVNTQLGKDDALAKCKELQPSATMIMPQSKHEQLKMNQFLKRNGFSSSIFLGAKKASDGHWYWDDGSAVFTECNSLKCLIFSKCKATSTLDLDWTKNASARIGKVYSSYYAAIYAIDGIVGTSDTFIAGTGKDWEGRYVEITLPETLLISKIKVLTIVSNIKNSF